MDRKQFDVFLSHNSADKPAVEELARRLKGEGIESWFDKWHLVPGEPWQQALERALADSSSVAVFVGPGGFGPWQNEEMRAALARRVSESEGNFRVIPVLLPGGTREERSRMPTFLVASTWVEFRQSLDEEEAFHRLKAGIRGQAPGAAPGEAVYEGKCPYRGLKAFQAEHAAFFFGREARIEWLLNALRPAAASSSGETPRENRFLGIIGASGSGKSSLARAGLVPALRQGKFEGSTDWPIVICRPGPDPLESLATALAADATIGSRIGDVGDLMARLAKDETRLHLTTRVALGADSESQRVVIVVDQFEELFTLRSESATSFNPSRSLHEAFNAGRSYHDTFKLDPGAARRKAFIDNLIYAAGIPGGKTIVVLTVRADFYGKCASFANLAAALSEHQDLVGPMTSAELREVIERPAQLVGLELERGLTEMLLRDMENQPGALPLLQHALWELWQRREGRRLTIAAYEAIGGLEGALEKQANDVFEALSPDEQETCRRLFLRLTQPGEGSEDTKCRVAVSQVGDSAATASVIQRLTNVRLITSEGHASRPDESFVEVSHEALIRCWSKLRGWIDADREALRTQHRLTEAATEWDDGKQDDGYLYHGARLAEAEEWAKTKEADLTPLEKRFLAACLEQRDRGKREEEQRQARELETMKQLAESETQRATEQAVAARRSKRLSFAALALTAFALVAFVWAARAQREAVKYAHEIEQAKKTVDDAKLQIEEELAQNLLERIHPVPGHFGTNEFPGLWQIASLPPEKELLRTLMMSIGLKSDDAAARFSNRAPYFAQALIGLDGARRAKFLNEFIKPTLKQTTVSPTIRLACVRLGIALKLDDPKFEFAEQAVRVLSETLIQTSDLELQDALAEDLTVAVRLFPRADSQRAVKPIIDAMQRIPDAHVLRLLCDAVADTPARIEKPEGRLIAQRLLTVMEKDPERGSKLEMLRELSRSLRSLPENLELERDGRGLKLLVQLIADTGNPEIHNNLVDVVKSLAPLASGAQCRDGVKLFERAMSESQDTQDAQVFARCLAALATRMAQSDKGQATEMLLSAMQKTEEADSLWTLSEGLSQLPGQLTESDGRKAIARLLDVMERARATRYLRVLAESLTLFPVLLSEDDLARAKKRLLSEIRADVVPPDLEEVSQGLAVLPMSLSPEDSSPALKILVEWVDRVTKPQSLQSLSSALTKLGGKMTPDGAELAAKPILAAMSKTPASEKIHALASGLSGMTRDGKPMLSAATINAAYQLVLGRMNDKSDVYFGQPINLSLLAKSFKILPGNTPLDVANGAIRQLLEALVKTENADALEFLVDGLGDVGGDLSNEVGEHAVRQIVAEIKTQRRTRLKRVQILGLAAISIALETAGKFPETCASDVVLQFDYAMNVTTDNNALQHLAEAMALILPKLPPEAVDTRGKALRRIRLVMESTKATAVIGALAQGWEVLAADMTTSETHDAFQELLIKLKDPANAAARPELTRAAVAMAKSSDSSQVLHSLGHLLSALQNDLDPQRLDVFLDGIKVLAAKVGAKDFDRAKARIIAVSTERTRLNDQVMNGLIQALDALPGEIATRELVELLKSPFCIGDARQSLLKMIETQTKLRFDGNPWNLVDRAKEAGLDPQNFREPVKRPPSVTLLEDSIGK